MKKRSLRNRTIIGTYVLVTMGMLLAPLVNVLHAESAAVLAMVGFFVAGMDAIGRFKKGASLGFVLRRHAGYLSIPFLLFQIARLWMPGCGFLVGLKFYFLFPAISVFLGVSIAWVLSGSKLRRKCLWFGLGGVALMVMTALFDLGFHPQFFVYNHIFGGILGPIYDLELSVRPGLYVFRLLTVFWALLFVLIGNRLHARARSAHRDGGTALLVVAIMLIYANAAPLGINTSHAVLVDRLGASVSTQHFEIYYDSASVELTRIERIAADHEFRYDQLVSRLGFEVRGTIRSYLYPSASKRAALTGAGFTNISPVWLARPQVHVLLDAYERVFTHELAHVFSREMGVPVLRASLHVGLVEGFAVAMEPPVGLPPPHDQVAAFVDESARDGVYGDESLAEAVSSSLSATGFWTGRSAVSYTTMGSFVTYLLDTHGSGKFAAVYGMDDFESVYGASIAELAGEWENMLARRSVSLDVSALAARRFAVPSLFEQTCPHDLAPAYLAFRSGELSLAEGDTVDALGHLSSAMSLAPQYGDAAVLWADIMLAQGGWGAVLEKLEAFPVPDSLKPPGVARALGDARALAGDAEGARQAFGIAAGQTSVFARSWRATVTLRMLTADRPDLVASLVSSDPPEVRAGKLAADASVTGSIWAALLYAEAEQFYEAAALLEAVQYSPTAAQVGQRIPAWLASFYFRAGNFDDAERFRLLAVEAALADGDAYEVARLYDFEKRVRWARQYHAE